MNPYIRQLNTYLANTAPDYGYSDAHSLLEMLYQFYTEHNPIDTDGIRSRFLSLEPYMENLSPEEQNRVFSVLCDIYSELEHTAFLEGLHVGARLAAELSGA